jgi:WD40 repeat protein
MTVENQWCRQCERPLEPGTLAGLCPQCLARLAFASEEVETPGRARPSTAGTVLRYFGDYELLSEIARGGTGVVYRARQLSLNRLVAVKMLLFGRLGDEGYVRRFKAEAEAVAVLQHPHIVGIHEVGEYEGQQYFSMDYVEGQSLAERARANPLPPELAADYLETIARAVHYAHQRGILHRDLKPSNILIHSLDRPRVTDFGLAKRLSAESDLTLTGQALGTPQYMAPEQAQGRRGEVTIACDVYALGAILYHLLTGQPPFVSDSVEGVLEQLLHAEPRPPRQLNPGVPRDLETICLKCLEKEPRKRYGSAEDLAADLGRFAAHEPIRAHPVSPTGRLWRWCRRKPALAVSLVLAALLMLTIALGASFLSWRLERARRAEHTQREHAVRANRQLSETILVLELQRAEQLFKAGDASVALASLARTLRQDPTNLIVAERLVSALLQRNFALPALPPLPHDGAITSVEFGPDGSRLLSVSRDHTARMWDVRSGQPALPPWLHQDQVLSARFSPDGRLVATGSADRTARLWDARTGQPLTDVLPHPAEVRCVAFSSDGRRLATGGADRRVRIWDAREGTPLGEFAGHTDTVGFVQFGPDGEWVVSASDDHTARLWESHTAHPNGRILQHSGKVTVAQFSPDGRWVLTASLDGTACLWSTRVADEPATRLMHGQAILWAAFSPDGRTVVTASVDRTARLWEPRTGRLVVDPLWHDSEVSFAKFSPDGQRLVTVSTDNAARLWDVRTGQLLTQRLRQVERPVVADFTPDGQRLAVAGFAEVIQVWDILPGQAVGAVLPHEPNRSLLLANAEFSPDGCKVAATDGDFTARLWDVSEARPLGPPLRHGTNIHAVRFAPDGQTVVTTGDDGRALRWDVRTGSPKGEPLRQGGRMVVARFDSDGRRIVTTGTDRAARVWEVRTGQILLPPLQHQAPVRDARFSPDGTRVATCSEDHTIGIWEARAGHLLQRIQAHRDTVESIEFSPDGDRLVSASSDNTARVWDARSGVPCSPPLHHTRSVVCATFSPDGQRIATASLDNTVRLWDAHTGEPTCEPLLHEQPGRAVHFSPDGQRVLTVCWGASARIWDARLGQPLGELRHENRVDSAEWHPRGELVVTAAMDGTARLWETPRLAPPIPDWLPDLAEAMAGVRFNHRRMLELVPWDEFAALRARFSQVEDRVNDPYRRIARWLLADRRTRTLSPSSKISLPGYVHRRLTDDTLGGLREAVFLAPDELSARRRLEELEQNASPRP